MNCAYLMRCADGSYYAGWTNDVAARAAAHAAGKGAKYTRSRLPARLAWWQPCATQSEAMRLEARLKRMEHAEKAALAAPWGRARAWLAQSLVDYADLLDQLDHGAAWLAYEGPEGVALRSGDLAVLACAQEAGAEGLLAQAGDAALVCVHGTALAAAARRQSCWQPQPECCTQWVYRRATPPPVPQGLDLRRLTPRFAPAVAAAYSHYPDEGYLRECIAAGTMLGAFVDGKLAGFIGLHAEGSMGILEILPPYRRRGLGAALEAANIAAQLARGRTPYAHVVDGNAASTALQEKLGLERAQQPVLWWTRK